MSLDTAGSLIALLQATKACIDYIKDVRDAKEEKRALLDELLSAHTLLNTIQLFANPDTGQTYLAATRDLISKGGLDLYKDSLEELQRLAGKNRFKWPFQKKDVEKHLATVERAKSLLTLVIQGDHVKLSSAIYEEVQRMTESLKNAEHISRTDAERGVLDWISRSTPELDHQRIAKARLPGTGEWFLQRKEFAEWHRNSEPSGLWTVGHPGVGKTILSSLVIDELLEIELENGAGVAYFYFDYTKRGAHTADYLLRSIIRQLSALKTPLPRALLDFYKAYSSRPIFASVLASVLSLVVQEFTDVFVVVDALDEFEEGAERVELLEYLTTLSQNSFKLLVTSRPHPNDIKRKLSAFRSLEVEASADDIRAFLSQTIEKDSEAVEVMEEDEDLREDIVNTLMERAKGMFLLPKLQIRGILQQQSSRDMREALEELPDQLDLEFDKTWERIQSQHKSRIALAEKTLTWLCFARTALRIDDIRDALSIRPNDVCPDIKGRPNPKGIANCCFGLVTLDTTHDVIRFVHYSVQEYFRGSRAQKNFPEGQALIAQTCITYLTFKNFSQPCKNRQVLDQRLQEYPFLQYVACHWGYHCSQSEDEDTNDQAYEKIIESPAVYQSMLQALCSFEGNWGLDRDDVVQGYITLISRYHFAAAFGLVSVLLKLFESQNAEVTMLCDARGRFPIHYAAANGHEGMVTLLSSMGMADLTAMDDDGRTPVALAAEAGHKAVTKLLLEEEGVKIDSKDKNGETPLFLAARGGHVAIIEMLLQKGSIDLNPRQMFNGTTPIMEAAVHGHDKAVRVMAEHDGIAVDAMDSVRRTPLSLAAERNYVETAQVLLECPQVNINSEDVRGHTPLFHAAWAGAFEMLRYLISRRKIDINHRSHFGETPLSIAARSGYDSCVRLLLSDTRTEVNTQDFELRSPLEHAVRNGYGNVVRLFLQDPRVKLSTKNGWSRTPLHYAIRSKYVDISEMLEQEMERRQNRLPYRFSNPVQPFASGGPAALHRLEI